MMFAQLAKTVLELLKLGPRYLMPLALFIALFCGILLFGPKEFLQRIGAFEVAEDHRSWIGVIFLASFSLLLVCIGVYAVQKGKRWLFRIQSRRIVKERLHSLTEDEKQILRYYIYEKTKTNVLQIGDGIVNGLESSRIIFRSTNAGSLIGGFSYNITDFAWDYLNKNQRLLDGETNIHRTDTGKVFRLD